LDFLLWNSIHHHPPLFHLNFFSPLFTFEDKAINTIASSCP
jgi:hypothetical protein